MKIQLAGCVILDDYGRILLLHRNTERFSQWELPGGKVEPNEPPEQAAIRELDEELGIKVRLVKPLGSGAFKDEEHEYQYAWYQAVITEADPTLRETETFDDLDYFDLEDLPSLALSANMQILLPKIVSGEVVLRA